jgi:hypothetical protein
MVDELVEGDEINPSEYLWKEISIEGSVQSKLEELWKLKRQGNMSNSWLRERERLSWNGSPNRGAHGEMR